METLTGTLDSIRFQKDGYLIANLKDGVSVKGNMPSPQVGMVYKFEGRMESNSRWGDTFKFEDYETAYPKESSAIRLYLMENCKWIGPQIATKIVQKFNSKTLTICKEDPEFVSKEIPGLTLQRAQEISLLLRGNEQKEKLQIELNKIFGSLKVPKRVVFQIIEKWGLEGPKEIKRNPYQLIDLFEGVGFLTADSVALEVGYDPKGEPRLKAGILHVIREIIFSQGHTIISNKLIVQKCAELMKVDKSLILPAAIKLEQADVLTSLDEYFTLTSLYKSEKYISKKIQEILIQPNSKVEPDLNGLAEDQKEALLKAVSSRVFILTGAPGTGKTFTIKKIITSFPDADIRLAAPTGKAAKRIIEQTGQNAETIHRMMDPMMIGGKFVFTRDAENPIEADIIVLDEMSMVDVPLMSRFLEAVSTQTRLILVGDIYQLPSVGAGNVLKDLIASGAVPTTELTIIKRQDEGLIIRNCHKIKNGENINLENSTAKDFFFLKRDSEAKIKESIIDLVKNRLGPSYKINPLKDVQVISPLREKTSLSCKSLNKALQEELNKNPKIEKSIFRVGDKVIQTKNDYKLGIINGDIGFITSMDKKFMMVKFEAPDRDVEIPLYGNDLELAYAVTCHKYQGSEAPIIIIPIHDAFGPFIMQRNWIYTAISRAKDVCILVGHRGEVQKIIKRNQQQKRFTLLTHFLKNN